METRNEVTPPQAQQPQQPHVVLFFDVNGTIIAQGASHKDRDLKFSLWRLIAENYEDVWNPELTDKPMSFSKFCWKILVPKLIAEDNARRVKRGYVEPAESYEVLNPIGAGAHVVNRRKTKKEIEEERYYKTYQGCVTYFAEYLKAKNHPLLPVIQKEFDQLAADAREGNVFKSFIRAVQDLEQQKVPYTVVLRSYGADTTAIAKEIEERTGIKFPMHYEFNSGVLNHKPKKKLTGKYAYFDGDLDDFDEDAFDASSETAEDLGDDDGYAMTAEEMLKLVKPGVHGAWDDDNSYWSKHGSTRRFGKPFPVDINDRNVVSVFFDDEAATAKRISPKAVGKQVTKQECDALHEDLMKLGRIVPVDTHQALLDKDYYRRHIFHAINVHNNQPDGNLPEFVSPPVRQRPAPLHRTRAATKAAYEYPAATAYPPVANSYAAYSPVSGYVAPAASVAAAVPPVPPPAAPAAANPKLAELGRRFFRAKPKPVPAAQPAALNEAQTLPTVRFGFGGKED